MASTSASYDRLSSAARRALGAISQPRERAVVERRYGFGGTRYTLSQIGDILKVTRERVRQLENAGLASAKAALVDSGDPAFAAAEADIVTTLARMGRAAHVDDLTLTLMGEDNTPARGTVNLISELSPKLVVVPGNSAYFPAVVLSESADKRSVRADVDRVVAALRRHGKPVTMDEFPRLVKGFTYPQEVAAIAGLSRRVVKRDGQWGLPQWSNINPRNIRDRICIALTRAGQPLHFTAIADAVNAGSPRQQRYSDKVINNGLIKDSRFVLIGRGVYALAEWGYQSGSVADIISRVLRDQSPLTREEIVRRVQDVRQIGDRTIRLNLHSNPRFKRISKTLYALEEPVLVEP